MNRIVRSFALLLAVGLLAGGFVQARDDKAKPKAKPKPKSHTFHGMVVLVSPTGSTAAVDIKHSNGHIRTFNVDAKTKFGGQGVTGLQGLKKGQMVKVHHTGHHAGKIDVEKKAPNNPNLTGKTTTFSGTVTSVVADQFGDNGKLSVKDAKGVVKNFDVHNETNIDYKRDGKTITHTLQGIGTGMTVNVKSVGKDAVHIDAVIKPGIFHGMVVFVTNNAGTGSVVIKHSNGAGRGYIVDGKTKIAGLGVNALQKVQKGQIVTVTHFGKHATGINVETAAAPNPKLSGPTATMQGTVTKVVADQYGDNGKLSVMDPTGAVKTFDVHNETNIDYKQDGKTIIHTLQGVRKGMTVTVKSVGKDAVHIDVQIVTE